jgi:homocysteine S-methyltransferase
MNFLDRIAERPLLADGAMGTQLYARGFDFDQNYDALNLLQPDVVRNIHREYAAAGADLLETNTFGANHFRLDNWGLADAVSEICARGVELAREASRDVRPGILIAGAVGPLGVRLAPLGSVTSGEAYNAFVEQITALADAGADLIILETFSDPNEIEQALRAARDVCRLPVVAQMTFSREARTLLGATPEDAAARLAHLEADLVGANCSTGPRGVFDVVTRMRAAIDRMQPGNGVIDNGANGDGANSARAHRIRISAMPNAGFPEARGERVFYPATPDYFGDYARRFVESGVSLIGGCCGTTPEHIRAMRETLDSLIGVAQPTRMSHQRVESHVHVSKAVQHHVEARPTDLAQALADQQFVVTVEVEPPRSGDTQAMEDTARRLRDAGATVLDISDIPMARLRMTGLAAAHRVQSEADVETVLHFPVRGRNLLRVQGDLLAAHALNVRNLFVTMGDPTSIGDYPQASDHHDIVPTGLTQLIKQQFNVGKDISGASIGKPCSFVVGVAANLTPADFDKEAKLLKKKIECGADFALTQPVFDPAIARKFIAHYESLFGQLSLPVLVGILPLASVRHAEFLRNEVPGMALPDAIVQRLEAAGSKTRTEGMLIALEILSELRDLVQGVYIIPAFGRYDIVEKMIRDILGGM